MAGDADGPDEATPTPTDPGDGTTQPETEVYLESGSPAADPTLGFDETAGSAFAALERAASGRGPEPEPIPGPPAFDDWIEAAPPGAGTQTAAKEPGWGDGPFPVDVDAPGRPGAVASATGMQRLRSARSSVASAAPRGQGALSIGLELELSGSPPLETPRSRSTGLSGLGASDLGAAAAAGPLAEPVRVERRRRGPSEAKAPAGGQARRDPKTTPPRRYPKMRARLSNPELVPDGIAPPPEPRPPPVPGTFIPHPPPRPPRPARADLDQMLALMAEGLFVREGEASATEIRVTLRDEFFAGTELRIALDGGRVDATLMPPNREVFGQLDGEADQLRARLEARGLRVAQLQVVEPPP